MRIAAITLKNHDDIYFPRVVESNGKVDIYFLYEMRCGSIGSGVENNYYEELMENPTHSNDIRVFTFPKVDEVIDDWIRYYNAYRGEEKHITVFISRREYSADLIYYHTHFPNISIHNSVVEVVIKKLEESDKFLMPEIDNKNKKTKLSFISGQHE